MSYYHIDDYFIELCNELCYIEALDTFCMIFEKTGHTINFCIYTECCFMVVHDVINLLIKHVDSSVHHLFHDTIYTIIGP